MIKRLLFILMLLGAMPAHATSLPMDQFQILPVQHEGRIKPVDTFARQILSLLAGKESLPGMKAADWLAEAIFDPAVAMSRPVFRVLDPAQLNLPARKGRLYSFAELAPLLHKRADIIARLLEEDDKQWDKAQAELIRLHESVLIYAQIVRSFSYLLPLNIAVPKTLAKDWQIEADKTFTLEDFTRYQKRLENVIQTIIRKKGDDPALYNEEEQAVTAFAFQIGALRAAGEQNIFLRIIPGQWDSAKGEWFSPWALTQAGQGSPRSAAYLDLWQKMATAYLEQDAQEWRTASAQAKAMSESFSPAKKMQMERFYTTFHPLSLALGLYFIAFLFLITQATQGAPIWRLLSILSVMGGIVLHTAAIALRIAILERAPVGTLYESIVFVALVCAIGGMIVERRRQDGTGLLAAILCGLILLFTAFGFSGPDTMQVLVAVLNTNFWLSTHVLCITAGYGVCLLTSLLAHMWLVRRAMGHDAAALTAPIKTLALTALLFTSVGTILGGIWADQSWGRFWGWDPKETGALLIVLWLIWVLHGQISAHIKTTPAMACYAALSIVVALAWFGVNLLNVGLHSYGFITGVAAGLGAFVAAEIFVIGGLWFLIQRKAASV